MPRLGPAPKSSASVGVTFAMYVSSSSFLLPALELAGTLFYHVLMPTFGSLSLKLLSTLPSDAPRNSEASTSSCEPPPFQAELFVSLAASRPLERRLIMTRTNSAGAAGNFVAPISGLSSNAFRTVMEIDVLGTYNTVKATIPYLVESAKRNPNPSTDGLTGGRILAVSAAFHYTGTPMQAHVMAAKASVDNIMVSVALEYGPHGVTANVITPGGIEGTEGMERLASSKNTAKQLGRSIPLGRMGTIRDIADATVFLFSDAGNYVNGDILVVDGAAWRSGSAVGLDEGMKYPDYLLEGKFSPHVKSGRKDKPKL